MRVGRYLPRTELRFSVQPIETRRYVQEVCLLFLKNGNAELPKGQAIDHEGAVTFGTLLRVKEGGDYALSIPRKTKL